MTQYDLQIWKVNSHAIHLIRVLYVYGDAKIIVNGARYKDGDVQVAASGINRVMLPVINGNSGLHGLEVKSSKAILLYIPLQSFHRSIPLVRIGTGKADEIGKGDAKNTIINCPLPEGSGDDAFLKAFREKLVPAADQFKPDFVFISAGFDAHQNDPLGGMKLTAGGYASLTRIVAEIADKHANGLIVSALEGGYDVSGGGLAQSAEAHINALIR